MRAIRLEQPRQLNYVEIPEPLPPGPGQALVRTHRMGICGTDLSGYLGRMPFFKYPRIPGHELGVEVIAVGEGVTQVSPGDRCSVEPYLNCGSCFPCRRGQGNCCENLNVIGVMVDGGLCQEFLIRADKLHPSKLLNYEQLALVETLAIGCHATDRGAPQAGDHVLIIGAGPIGLSVLEFTRLTGAQITLMDLNEERLKFCRDVYSVPNTIQFLGDGSEIEEMNRITCGDRFLVVIDATGNAQSMSSALRFVASTGRLVYVGITTGDVQFPHPLLHRPEMTIYGSRNAMPDDFPRIIRLIEEGVIRTDSWITHRVPFDDLVREFECFTRPETGAIKAIVELT